MFRPIFRSLFATSVFALACSNEPSTDNPEGRTPNDTSDSQGGSTLVEEACVAPSGVSASPKTIRQLVELLDALPRPTSVACFLQSLNRPLAIYGTRSQFSVQPAGDDDNPRIFVVNGNLTFAIVPSGPASNLLEFGYFVDDDRSVKGEVLFPIEEPLSDSALAEQVALGGRTRCGSCHDPEQPAEDGHYEGAFVSIVIAPSPDLEVPLDTMLSAATSCDWEAERPRCEILSALFDFGEVESTYLWPSNFR